MSTTCANRFYDSGLLSLPESGPRLGGVAAILAAVGDSKKLRNLEMAFGLFAAYYNYCWQNRHKGKSGKKRPTAFIMAGLAGHVWSFDELFAGVLA